MKLQIRPKRASLTDTQYVLAAYVTIYIGKEREEYCPSKNICQYSAGTSHMLDLVQEPVTKYV